MKVQHRLILLPKRADARGSLMFAQEPDDLPFGVKRIFVLYDMAEYVTRGGHAHRRQHQFLLMTNGACTIRIDNGHVKETVRLDEPCQALYAPPGLWLDLTDFTKDASCLVLASDRYDESEYIRDYQEFLRLSASIT